MSSPEPAATTFEASPRSLASHSSRPEPEIRPAAKASSTRLNSYADLARSVAEVQEGLDRLAGAEAIEAIPDEMVRSLLTMGVQLYYAKRTAGAELVPLDADALTASEVALATADMVKAVQLELFEIALWNSFGRP